MRLSCSARIISIAREGKLTLILHSLTADDMIEYHVSVRLLPAGSKLNEEPGETAIFDLPATCPLEIAPFKIDADARRAALDRLTTEPSLDGAYISALEEALVSAGKDGLTWVELLVRGMPLPKARSELTDIPSVTRHSVPSSRRLVFANPSPSSPAPIRPLFSGLVTTRRASSRRYTPSTGPSPSRLPPKARWSTRSAGSMFGANTARPIGARPSGSFSDGSRAVRESVRFVLSSWSCVSFDLHIPPADKSLSLACNAQSVLRQILASILDRQELNAVLRHVLREGLAHRHLVLDETAAAAKVTRVVEENEDAMVAEEAKKMGVPTSEDVEIEIGWTTREEEEVIGWELERGSRWLVAG